MVEHKEYDELDLLSLFVCFKRMFLKLAAVAVIVAIIVFAAYPHNDVHNTSATGMIFLHREEIAVDGSVSNTCIDIIKNYTYSVAAEQSGIPVSEISASMTIQKGAGTNIMIIAVSPTTERAVEIANAVVAASLQVLPEIVEDVEFFAGGEPTFVEYSRSGTMTAAKYGIAAGAAVFVLLAAIFLCKEIFDGRIKDEQTVKAHFAAPVLGVIPELKKDLRNKTCSPNPMDSSDVPAIYSEAYKTLRANLLFAAEDKDIKTIVVTSSVAEEDTFNAAVNLAMSLAKAGKKTVIADFCMQGSTLESYLPVLAAKGVKDILTGDHDAASCLSDTNEPLLKALLSGGAADNSSELVLGDKVRQLIAQLKESFDFVIMVAPPALTLSDAASLSALADGTLLVARTRYAKVNAVKFAEQKIATVGGKIFGLVLTRLDVKKLYSSTGYAQAFKKH